MSNDAANTYRHRVAAVADDIDYLLDINASYARCRELPLITTFY